MLFSIVSDSSMVATPIEQMKRMCSVDQLISKFCTFTFFFSFMAVLNLIVVFLKSQLLCLTAHMPGGCMAV